LFSSQIYSVLEFIQFSYKFENVFMSGHVYIIWIREFVRLRENTYKIGRTSRDFIKRFNEYPNGSIAIITARVTDNIEMEKHLMHNFKICFTHKIEYGNEYFNIDSGETIETIESDKIKMIDLFKNTINTYDPNAEFSYYFPFSKGNHLPFEKCNSDYFSRSIKINVEEQKDIYTILNNIEHRYKTEIVKLNTDIQKIRTYLSNKKKEKQD